MRFPNLISIIKIKIKIKRKREGTTIQFKGQVLVFSYLQAATFGVSE